MLWICVKVIPGSVSADLLATVMSFLGLSVSVVEYEVGHEHLLSCPCVLTIYDHFPVLFDHIHCTLNSIVK
jgi:hypothetical protein